MNKLLAFYVRTLRLAEPGAEVVPAAARGAWDLLDEQERAELLASVATDRVGTARERPGDKQRDRWVDGPAMFRLVSYGLITENARLSDPLLTPVGQLVADWAERHQTGSAPPGNDGVGSEDSREI